MSIERIDPTQAGGEVETVLGFLDYHRQTLRMKTGGLDATRLHTAHPPSTLTLGGLLHHLALVESSWLSEVFLGQEAMEPFASADWDADRDWEFTTAPDHTPEVLRARYDESVERSDGIIRDALAAGGLEQLSVRPSRDTGELFSLRWILLHLIEEYARHNGHADLIREAVDGTTGE